MGAVDKISILDFREKMTRVILETLSQLPETHKQMFVWRHYQGLDVVKIASNLHCSQSDVEGVLHQIDLALTRQAGALLV